MIMNFQHVKILALTELSRAVLLNTCTWMMEQFCMHFPAYQNLIYFSCRGKSTELYQMLASGCHNGSFRQCWMQLKRGNLQLNDAEKWCYWTVFITWDWPSETRERIEKRIGLKMYGTMSSWKRTLVFTKGKKYKCRLSMCVCVY